MSSDDLELRVAWERHLGPTPTALDWLVSVIRRHREDQRHYHALHHVTWVVRHIGELAAFVDDLDAVVAAAFFHDAIYDPTAGPGENERASARLARRALGEIGWTDERADRVADMIEATAGHDAATPDGDTQVLLAADFAVLAAEPARYADYVTAVRREYAHLDDGAWRSGRAAVLHGFLERDHLFAPELGLDDWERRARANITAELASLER